MPSHNAYAYLGMYDFPALRPAQDIWWSGLAGHFERQGFSGVPRGLSRTVADPYDIWRAPNLFFAQTCGYPLTHRLAGKVRLLGTPWYDAPGCDGALYSSLFVVRRDQLGSNLATVLPARIAVNAMDSYSGWRAVCATADELGIGRDALAKTIISGSHANSIDLVRRGEADIAAIDCVTHALMGDVEPERLAGTRVLQRSVPVPGLPYITRPGMSEADLRRMVTAIRLSFDDPRLDGARRVLRLAGFSTLPLADYERRMA